MIKGEELVSSEHPNSRWIGDADVDLAESAGGTFARRGAIIHYWTVGPDSAPAVVLTHGTTLDHGTYAEQITAVCRAGYRVVVWDLRGHGASQPMGERISFENTVEDLGALMNEVGIDRAVLVGQSYGGTAIQEYYRRQSHRVAALVLVGALELGVKLSWHERLLSRTRPFVLRLWPEKHLRRVIPSFMSKRSEVQRYVQQAIRPMSKDGFVAVTEAALEGMHSRDRLERIDVPVALIHGEMEMALVLRSIREWAARDPRVRVEVVPAAGHLANQDNPAAFNEILLRFLRQHVPIDA
jgi:3-oxoadipate enol-lactonase